MPRKAHPRPPGLKSLTRAQPSRQQYRALNVGVTTSPRHSDVGNHCFIHYVVPFAQDQAKARPFWGRAFAGRRLRVRNVALGPVHPVFVGPIREGHLQLSYCLLACLDGLSLVSPEVMRGCLQVGYGVLKRVDCPCDVGVLLGLPSHGPLCGGRPTVAAVMPRRKSASITVPMIFFIKPPFFGTIYGEAPRVCQAKSASISAP